MKTAQKKSTTQRATIRSMMKPMRNLGRPATPSQKWEARLTCKF